MKIAIIGSGIAGLTCAWRLAGHHDVTLFEANAVAGGHTATVDVKTEQGEMAIDTGFIVYNDRTYPRFIGLLSELGIQGQKTEMSFSVRNPQTGLEYNGHTLATLFAQYRNLVNPQFWRLLKEIVRFNRCAKQTLQNDATEGQTLETFLDQQGFSAFFAQHYILPMGAAIWSSSLKDMRQFPLALFLRFFDNHGLLDVLHRPQWYVVPGGSREYVRRIIEKLSPLMQFRFSTPVCGVTRTEKGSLVCTESGEEHFDSVIFACHADQALGLLNDPSEQERAVLGAMLWQSNDVVLHKNSSWLPVRHRAWASWNYLLNHDPAQQEKTPACVTYNMNILQGLPAGSPLFCVTLNPNKPIDECDVYQRFVYHHPVFNTQTWQAQARRSEINGQRHTWFCGAYWYNGFHEDGVHSAMDVVQGIAASQVRGMV